MDSNDLVNSRLEADVVIRGIKEHPEFLQWDREINGKLYYALWILFMGGFVLSIGYTNQRDLFSNCLVRPLLHLFRLLAIIGSVANFFYQNRAINAVRAARELSMQMHRHRALADDEETQAAKEAFALAENLHRRLITTDRWNSRLGTSLIICAVLFLTISLIITWNIVPIAQPR